jgi:hypothetical protein
LWLVLTQSLGKFSSQASFGATKREPVAAHDDPDAARREFAQQLDGGHSSTSIRSGEGEFGEFGEFVPHWSIWDTSPLPLPLPFGFSSREGAEKNS